MPAYPNATTLCRFLLRLAPLAFPKFRRVHDRFRQRTVDHGQQRRFIFDLDSTVVVVYGRQEQARRGYDPQKRGRLSYHPLLCFEGLRRDYWAGELRPGDAHTALGAIELLETCFAQLPPGVRRADARRDKGFYNRKIVQALEAQRAAFVIVARLTRPIKAMLPGLAYTGHRGGVETAKFGTSPTGGRTAIASW